MKIPRIIYAILVITLTVAYFKPWLISGGQIFPGWTTILPFSFFYFIGLVTAVVILFTGYRAVGLSILAGTLMIGSNLLSGVFLGFGIAFSKSAQLGSGFVLAFPISVIFIVLGPICGSYFDKTKNINIKVSKEGFWSKLFFGLLISIIAALLLHYIFHVG